MGRALIIGGAVLVALYLLARKGGQVGQPATTLAVAPPPAVDVGAVPTASPTLSGFVNGAGVPSSKGTREGGGLAAAATPAHAAQDPSENRGTSSKRTGFFGAFTRGVGGAG